MMMKKNGGRPDVRVQAIEVVGSLSFSEDPQHKTLTS